MTGTGDKTSVWYQKDPSATAVPVSPKAENYVYYGISDWLYEGEFTNICHGAACPDLNVLGATIRVV